MKQQPNNESAPIPIWSVKVDYVMEFTDQAINDPAELAKLSRASLPEPSPSFCVEKKSREGDIP